MRKPKVYRSSILKTHTADTMTAQHGWVLTRWPGRRTIPIETRLAIYERDGCACVTCGTSDNLTLDHIRPISKGGTDDSDNLQTMCQPCDADKGNVWQQ